MAQPSADPLSQDSNLSELRRSVPPRVGPLPHTPVRPPPARRPPSARCLRLCTSHGLLGPYAVTTIDWIGFPFSRAGPKGNPTAYDERTIDNRAPSKAKRHLPIQERLPKPSATCLFRSVVPGAFQSQAPPAYSGALCRALPGRATHTHTPASRTFRPPHPCALPPPYHRGCALEAAHVA